MSKRRHHRGERDHIKNVCCTDGQNPVHEQKHTLILSVNSCSKLILKTENRGFSTFAGVFDPGNGRIGPALLKVPLAFLRDMSNDVCRFFGVGG